MVFTTTDPATTIFGLGMHKWGIFTSVPLMQILGKTAFYKSQNPHKMGGTPDPLYCTITYSNFGIYQIAE